MKKYLPRPSSSSIGLVLTYAILLLGRIFNLWNFNIRDRDRDKGDWELLITGTRDNRNNFKKRLLFWAILSFESDMTLWAIEINATKYYLYKSIPWKWEFNFFFWIRFWYNGRLLYIWRELLVEKLEVFCCSCLSVDLSVTPKFETDISCRLKDKRFHQTQLSIVAWIFFLLQRSKHLLLPSLLSTYIKRKLFWHSSKISSN